MKEALVFGGIVLGGVLLWMLLNREPLPRFRKKAVLTGSELEFFYRLRAALPECAVFAKVAASALIEPAGIGNARRKGVACLEGRRVGAAIFDEEMRLLAVAELDSRARVSRRDATIDACFSSAGIKVVRFHASRLPSEAKIRNAIFTRAKFRAAGAFVDNDSIEYKHPRTPWRNTLGAHI